MGSHNAERPTEGARKLECNFATLVQESNGVVPPIGVTVQLLRIGEELPRVIPTRRVLGEPFSGILLVVSRIRIREIILSIVLMTREVALFVERAGSDPLGSVGIVVERLYDAAILIGRHVRAAEVVGMEVAACRRDMAFRASVLEAYLAECCICGFSLRLVDGLIGVDAAHIRWHAHGGPDDPGNEPRLAPQEIDLDMKTGMKIAIVRGR
jgi:hypothetical protein